MTIENVELVDKCCPQHSCTGIAKDALRHGNSPGCTQAREQPRMHSGTGTAKDALRHGKRGRKQAKERETRTGTINSETGKWNWNQSRIAWVNGPLRPLPEATNDLPNYI